MKKLKKISLPCTIWIYTVYPATPLIGYLLVIDMIVRISQSDSPRHLVKRLAGIESSMELELKGQKGSQTAYVDNVGRILTITDEVQPVAGNDIWLTLDLNLQKAIYNILERQLAGLLFPPCPVRRWRAVYAGGHPYVRRGFFRHFR